MGTVDKEKVQIIRNFFAEHPEAAKEFARENPGVLEWLTGNVFSQEQTETNSQSMQNGNSIGGKQLVKTMPGAKIPKMFDWDDSGFSNYLMLAVLAFSIQLIITLICIFFYK